MFPHNRFHRILVSAISIAMHAGLVCATASGQIPAAPPMPLDPAVADVNPMQTSLRVGQPQLRLPLGFSQVFRVAGSKDELMRMSGALTATFPYSAYARDRKGTAPQVPAGTVFHIGLPPEAQQNDKSSNPDRDAAQNAARVDRRVITKHDDELDDLMVTTAVSDAQAPGENGHAPHEFPRVTPRAQRYLDLASGPTIANDETFRSQRIGELIQQAANAMRSGMKPAAELPQISVNASGQ